MIRSAAVTPELPRYAGVPKAHDLSARILTIRESQFYKTRLVPLGSALASALDVYVTQRAKEHPTQQHTALFLTRSATLVARYTAENIFRRLRVSAGVMRQDEDRYQPRLPQSRFTLPRIRKNAQNVSRWPVRALVQA